MEFFFGVNAHAGGCESANSLFTHVVIIFFLFILIIIILSFLWLPLQHDGMWILLRFYADNYNGFIYLLIFIF